jgi:ABC-2 type transport system permease protein
MSVLPSGFVAIVWRDLKRLWKDRVRLLPNLIQPLLYLFVLGAGLRGTSSLGGAYQPFIFPGVVALSALFTSTYSGISIVLDREFGFLKAVLVAPVSRREIALAKIASGAIQALLPAGMLLALSPLVGVSLDPARWLVFVAALALVAMTFSSMGVALAVRFKSTEVFPVMLNAFILPLFFLSGALFPLDSAPPWLQVVAAFDPIAYGVDLLRGIVTGAFHLRPLLSVAVLAAVLAVFAWGAVAGFKKGEDL